ncbi:MAG: dihydroorotate dehydrogenase [Bacteroidota bacterium]|nr:dihydroorotate dehydrogenase [Bacteroidota bacterium]MDP4234801.1 dihydroorotate dehydrogenase [Bacteroidota bacterium]MDP4244167.1 dihydroorotate dehydrogenase [Bacteroidota bacterium]MDP4289339.1 dihydroorotate dehydrogenase [Bacteroidota bacterium]
MTEGFKSNGQAHPEMRVRLRDVEFKNPVLVASGTFGYGAEAKQYCDIEQLGGIVTKSVSWKPRPGNPPHRIIETASGMLNSIGLANVGVHSFVSEKLPYLAKFDTKIIANIAASSMEEYRNVLEHIEEHATPNLVGYEINISCPNVKDGGLSFGTSVERTEELTALLRQSTDKLLIIKLTPNVTSVAPFAQACERAGADAISLINTLVGMSIDIYTREPRLNTVTGGLSGPAIKPIALAQVYQARKACKLPIIGIGGIATAEDTVEFLIAGASMVQIGTANFVHPDAGIRVANGLVEYLHKQKIAAVGELVNSLTVRAELKAAGW